MRSKARIVLTFLACAAAGYGVAMLESPPARAMNAYCCNGDPIRDDNSECDHKGGVAVIGNSCDQPIGPPEEPPGSIDDGGEPEDETDIEGRPRKTPYERCIDSCRRTFNTEDRICLRNPSKWTVLACKAGAHASWLQCENGCNKHK